MWSVSNSCQIHVEFRSNQVNRYNTAVEGNHDISALEEAQAFYIRGSQYLYQNKLDLAIRELQEALPGEDMGEITGELGDILFTAANLCTFMGVDPSGRGRSSRISRATTRCADKRKSL